jgi:cation transport ATPase
MNEHDVVEYKVRRATGLNALRRIGRLVAEEQQTDADDARAIRWFMRYGWLVALGVAVVWAYWAGVI